MRQSALLCIVCVMGCSLQAAESDVAYQPLRLYQGDWQSTTAGTGKSDHISNQCALIGKYFGCQQTVNGKISALIVFVPAETAGHYYTQAVLPEGWAAGRGELEISGQTWIITVKRPKRAKQRTIAP